MSAAISFYFDFISPNAYLAWKEIGSLAARHGRPLQLRPVLFAALLQAHGQRGPAEVAPKLQWMQANCLRKAGARGIRLRAPSSHPFNPLLALRVCAASEDSSQRSVIVDALFDAAWADAREISDPGTVTAVLDAAGLDGAALVARAGSDELKRELRETTDEAIEAGVFGVPTMICDGSLFFGYDDLHWLRRFLDGDDPLDPDELERWRQVRPTAQRRQR